MALMWRQCKAWWHHQMETFSALLTFCEGNPPQSRYLSDISSSSYNYLDPLLSHRLSVTSDEHLEVGFHRPHDCLLKTCLGQKQRNRKIPNHWPFFNDSNTESDDSLQQIPVPVHLIPLPLWMQFKLISKFKKYYQSCDNISSRVD